MRKIRLGKTELMVTSTAMGCLPVQRCDEDYAVRLLRAAYEGGINYFDTANAYTDSEKKIGLALSDVREQIILSTKSAARDKAGVLAHIENSLRMMKTDYIDLFQFHQVTEVPDPNDPNGAYAGALEAREKGWIRHIGVTSHRVNIAEECIASGLFETLQFPFSYISSERDLALAQKCKEADMGFIAMKGLSGGLLNNAAACYAFMAQYDNVVPIWGIQHEWELDQWIELTKNPPALTEELKAVIEHDRKELAGSFCRSCGYCLPCAANIDIPQSARMSALLRRSPYQKYMTEVWYEKMHRIENCLHCDACKSRCPYGLDTPALLRQQLLDYDAFYAEHHNDK